MHASSLELTFIVCVLYWSRDVNSFKKKNYVCWFVVACTFLVVVEKDLYLYTSEIKTAKKKKKKQQTNLQSCSWSPSLMFSWSPRFASLEMPENPV